MGEDAAGCACGNISHTEGLAWRVGGVGLLTVLGEGTGAAVAYHLLRCAAAVFNEMATFDGAGVTGDTCG